MIKEFDLDAPQESKPIRLRFRNETRCVTALFERCYAARVDAERSWKILVELVEEIDKPGVRDLLGVCTTQIIGSVEDFLKLDDKPKKEATLSYLMEGVEKIACELEWQMSEFHDAKDQVISREFINEWVWKSAGFNSEKSLKGELLIEHEITEVRLSARFLDDKNKTVKIYHLVSDDPNEFIFYDHLGKFGWVRDGTVELVSRDGSKRYSASIGGE